MYDDSYAKYTTKELVSLLLGTVNSWCFDFKDEVDVRSGYLSNMIDGVLSVEKETINTLIDKIDILAEMLRATHNQANYIEGCCELMDTINHRLLVEDLPPEHATVFSNLCENVTYLKTFREKLKNRKEVILSLLTPFNKVGDKLISDINNGLI